jgi:hypothetical protein
MSLRSGAGGKQVGTRLILLHTCPSRPRETMGVCSGQFERNSSSRLNEHMKQTALDSQDYGALHQCIIHIPRLTPLKHPPLPLALQARTVAEVNTNGD